MKKIIKILPLLSLTFLLISITFNNVNAQVIEGDDEKNRKAATVCTWRGKVVGYSNDCVAGPGACVDRDCYGNLTPDDIVSSGI